MDASANAIPRARAYAHTPNARDGRANVDRGDGGEEGAMDEKLASGGGWQPQVAGGGRKIAAKGDRMIG